MIYLGDYAENATVQFKWNTSDSNGASITRSTNGTIYVYEEGTTFTEVTTGVTDVKDFDGLTGVHHCRIVLTDAFYATGADYMVVLKAATIDGQTVNAVLAHFSIENRFVALNVVIPASPTADSAWDWIRALKYALVNKAAITEASGNSVFYKDNDTTAWATITAAFSSDGVTTTRKRIEP